MNRKKNYEKSGIDISSYDDKDSIVGVQLSPRNHRQLPAKSRIPVLANTRRELSLLKKEPQRDMSDGMRLNKVERDVRHKLLQRFAEIKYQEELDNIERKVQKTMTMMHLKSRDERICEIELELDEKLRESKTGERINENKALKAYRFPVEKTHEDMSELKKHIKNEMELQRLEIETLRKNIRKEISFAMDENYRQNEEIRQLIKEINDMTESRDDRSRPYSDGHLQRSPKAIKRIPGGRDLLSNDNDETGRDEIYDDYD